MKSTNKIKVKKPKRRIPVPQKPPIIIDSPKSYNREKEKVKAQKEIEKEEEE